MKTAIILADGVKQIVFTPENKQEKYALSLITPQDDIELLLTRGSIGEPHYRPFTAKIGESNGGYLRVYEDTESTILVLKPKEKES